MSSIVDTNGLNITSSVPKVKDCKPLGGQVYIELLTSQERLGTKLTIGELDNKTLAPQAYVLAVGNRVPADYDLKVGDRVVLSGSGVPMSNFSNSERDRVLIDISAIKAILVEDK